MRVDIQIKIHRCLRSCRRFFAVSPDTELSIHRFHQSAFERAFLLFQLFVCWHIAHALFLVPRFIALMGVTKKNYPPIVSWFEYIPHPYLVFSLPVFYLTSSVFCAVYPHLRISRVLLFLSYLLTLGFIFSTGKVNHDYSNLLWFLAFSIFLPEGRIESIKHNRSQRHYFLTVFWWMQLMYLSFYWLAGLAKFFEDFFINFLSVFELNSLGNVLASYLLRQEIADRALWANFFVENAWIGPPMFLGVIYLQLFSFMACFRPSLYPIFGFLIVLFHTLNILMIAIPFNTMAFGAALLFFCSPFYRRHSFKKQISDLPLLSSIISLHRKYSSQQSKTKRMVTE